MSTERPDAVPDEAYSASPAPGTEVIVSTTMSPMANRDTDVRPVARWADDGAMALTGHPGGPALGPPDGLVAAADDVAEAISRRSAGLGRGVDVDPIPLLAERAAIAGFHRQGRTSCGGATRLLRGADGWLAVSLARSDDVGLVDAWLGGAPGDDPWGTVAELVATRRVAELEQRGAELGLPVAALAPWPEPPNVVRPGLSIGRQRVGDAAATEARSLVVADLSSLWAGPLCGSVLAQAGATVWKVESTSRPDGARRGPTAFFDLMNAGKRSVAVDIGTDEGRRALQRIVAAADVVIEASRPRALEQLGIDRRTTVAAGRTRVWVAITAHGLAGPGRNRAGFGDDIAVAGGLVACGADGPVFCADAIADPLSGLVAAAATLDALATGGRWLLDVNMRRVAAAFAGPTLAVPDGLRATPPRARAPVGAAPPLGADTADVLADVDRRWRTR